METLTEDIEYLAQRFWSGFTLERWYGRLEEHNAVLGAVLIVRKFDCAGFARMVERIATGNLPENRTNPGEAIVSWLTRNGVPVALSPATAAHRPVAPEEGGEATLAAFVDLFDAVLLDTVGVPPPVRVILPDGSLSR
ncbi:hypothetical protein [Rhodococcus daqingensis]|uniref:Uncharacterized protein n=1 Tax=Rhodococcus daqingensis TaxID=2479363 RepID=A0ABW2RRG7_9NOCA